MVLFRFRNLPGKVFDMERSVATISDQREYYLSDYTCTVCGHPTTTHWEYMCTVCGHYCSCVLLLYNKQKLFCRMYNPGETPLQEEPLIGGDPPMTASHWRREQIYFFWLLSYIVGLAFTYQTHALFVASPL